MAWRDDDRSSRPGCIGSRPRLTRAEIARASAGAGRYPGPRLRRVAVRRHPPVAAPSADQCARRHWNRPRRSPAQLTTLMTMVTLQSVTGTLETTWQQRNSSYCRFSGRTVNRSIRSRSTWGARSSDAATNSTPRSGTHRACWRHYPEGMPATVDIRRAADRARHLGALARVQAFLLVRRPLRPGQHPPRATAGEQRRRSATRYGLRDPPAPRHGDCDLGAARPTRTPGFHRKSWSDLSRPGATDVGGQRNPAFGEERVRYGASAFRADVGHSR